MIIKITDGESTHFVECSGDVRIERVENMFNGEMNALSVDEPTAEHLHLIVDPVHPGRAGHSGVVIRPEGLPLRTYLTNWDAYLMSDKGKTVEVLHRME